MKYRLKDLQNFSATAQQRTISAAAQFLGISQPALSESLNRLESDLNVILFYRSRSGISLTPKGRDFFKKVQKLLAVASELESWQNEDQTFGETKVSIGCHPTVANYTLPAALTALQRVAPDFQLEIVHGASRTLQVEISRGKIDIGIIINPIAVPDLVVTKLGTDVFSIWQSSEHQTADCVIFDPQLVQVQALLKKWDKRPKREIHTESLELACRLCQAGLGYAIAPSRATQLAGTGLKTVKGLPTFADTIALVYRPEFGKKNAEKLLIQALRRVFEPNKS